MFGLCGCRILLQTERKEELDEHASNTSILPLGSALGQGGHHTGRLAKVNKRNSWGFLSTAKRAGAFYTVILI